MKTLLLALLLCVPASALEVEGQRVLVGAHNEVSLYSLEGRELWSSPVAGLRDCQFCDSGRAVFATGSGGWSIWDSSSRRLKAHSEVACTLAGVCRDGSLVAALQGNSVVCYDATGKVIETTQLEHPPVHPYDRMVIGADGLNLAMENAAGFYLYDIAERDCFGENTGHIAFSPDGLSLARQSTSGYMIDLTLSNGKGLTKPVQTHTDGPLQFSPDGQLILTEGQDQVQVWHFPGLEPVSRRDCRAGTQSSFGPDGRTLASWTPDGAITVWSAADGTTLAHFQAGPISGVVLGPHWLFTQSPAGLTRLSW